MGMIGRRKGSTIEEPQPKVKRKYDSTTHHNLCCVVGKWLRTRYYHGRPFADYVAVELVTIACENPDVFGWNSNYSTLIEVKITHSDFLNDKKKYCKRVGQVGDYKYYCCPTNVIKVEELPEGWGLLYYDGKNIELVHKASQTPTNFQSERAIICSILRRENIKKQVFNYKNYEK